MGVTDFLLLSCLGFAITAHAQDCSVPDGGPNMHLKDEYILKETFASGDRAAFACNTGYHSEGGSSSITCTAGSWSTVRLKCERNNCGHPGEVEHGQIHYPKENLFGDHIEITCNDGYRLVGKSRITCGAQGWMDRLPICEVVTCDPPPLVSDATFTPRKDSYDHGDAIRYSCEAGLTLSGPALISCSNNGTFQPAPPTCVKVECEDLDILNADWISGSRPPHGHKAVVEYRCRKGFKMVGQSTLICEINSQWSPEPPRCDVVTCDRPPLVRDTILAPHKDSYNYGEVVRYSCEAGLTLSGSESASCSDDGTFQPAPPTCIKVECEDLDILNADLIRGSQPPHGHKAVVEYKCRKGFKMVGQSTLTCEINSQWSPEPPRCDVVTCKTPPLVWNRIFSPVKEAYKYGDVVQYSCQTGFKLSGSNSVSCSDDGTFKPDPPTCTMLTCKSPSMLAKGIFSPVKEVYKYGDVVQYSCQRGFKLSGSESVSCSDDGTFKPDPPTCTSLYCKDPHVKHGHVTNGARPPYKPNDKVTYKCSVLYKMEGEPTLTCQADGQWSPPPPTCGVHPLEVVGVTIGTLIVVALSFVAYRYRGLLPSFQKKQGKRGSPVGPTLLAVKARDG
ncbi:complement receptor type 1-like isoform X2 [Pagrus major]|uniref:complement receptor type 1-like isoform X2 n=1 Tax=Pagrus major TaxID=143350 RepID=UPI003CC87952